MNIKILRTIADVKNYIQIIRRQGKTIGLVPTMGALHEGHLALMHAAKQKCDIVIASIFVNPIQFGTNEDFTTYPRVFESDCVKLESERVDAVFHPEPLEMYPQGFNTYIMVDGSKTDKLCGASRPGHFRGVATVVTKLIHITEADQVFFGQKDAQQVVVIKQFVQDLNMNVVIQVVPIVRDKDGLALSSRNTYLSETEKKAAYILSVSLKKAKRNYLAGETNVEALKKLTADSIMSEPLAKLDYVELYSFPALEKIEMVDQMVLLAVAVKFGQTRLIDNIVFGG
ncbi:pantoate--beta-alanine ligase [Propionispira arboris]|uniref:Pantothenate synthetase n=1 Tax=Propionispira arboris TaxID=84035 RepID=A0A1H6X671_9FIRM|nr:pantoate--beta-alanine ligase [Propionispira arboris]SEJ22087.1 pantoate--beta-alanine ligase [Propionispira arboris]